MNKISDNKLSHVSMILEQISSLDNELRAILSDEIEVSPDFSSTFFNEFHYLLTKPIVSKLTLYLLMLSIELNPDVNNTPV